MAEEQNPSVRKGTLQEQYADLFRRIAELEKEDVSPTWDRLLYAFTGIGDKELAAPSRQERKKAQKEIIAGLKVELESIGKELGEFPEKFEIIKARRLERAAERDINDKLKAQEKKEDAINDLKSEVETRLRKEIGVDLTESQERDLDRFVNLMGDIPYGQELDFEEIVGSQVLSSGQAMEDAVKAMFSEIPGIRSHHLTEQVGIYRRELGAEFGLGEEEPARAFEQTVLAEAPGIGEDPVEVAIRQAGIRHLILTQYLTGEGAKVTENDIRRNPAKYNAALDTYVRVVRQQLGADPLYFSMFQDPSMQQMLVAGIKARLWLDENGQLFQPDKNDEHYDLILQIRSGEKLDVPGHDEKQAAMSLFPSLLGAVDTALSLSGNTFGPEFSETLAMEQKLVDQEFIYAKLEEKLVRAGGDVSKPNVQLWLGSKAQSIAVQAMQALPFIAGISSQVQDQTPAWEKVFEMIEDLGALNPDTIETEGYALMAAGDQREFFAAWVRQDPGMLAAIPDPMDRELFINNGFNEIKQRWLASPIDEETGRRMNFSQWMQINAVREVPEILDIVYAIEGGLDSDVGRKEYFKNLARATLWAGTPILSDDPTPFENDQMDRIIHEAEQEFQNKGAIAGTFEDIVKEKLENWDAVVRGSMALAQQLDPTGPPGMTDFPSMALEGVAELEARIGGANLNVEVKNNNDLMIQLEGRMSIEQRIQDANIAAGRDPDPTRASRIRSLQVQLKDVRSEGTKLKGQQGERDKQAGLHELLTNDAQLAQAFATGNKESIQVAALARRINPSMVQDLVNMQRRAGLQDRGEKQFATPEEIAAEKRMKSIAAAKQAARTIRYDAQGNVMPGDPAQDEYNLKTGIRTDPAGNVVPPIPSNAADRVDEKGNALPGMARMIPNTELLDTQENRDAISGGIAAPGTRQGEGFETDDLGNILTDDEGKPIPVAPLTGGPDYVSPDLILGTRREWPKRFGSIARPIVSKPSVGEPIQEGKEDTPQPQGPIFGFDVPVGEGQRELPTNLPPAREQTAAQVITDDAGMQLLIDEEEKVPGSLKPRKGARNAT